MIYSLPTIITKISIYFTNIIVSSIQNGKLFMLSRANWIKVRSYI